MCAITVRGAGHQLLVAVNLDVQARQEGAMPPDVQRAVNRTAGLSKA
jgi:hypothetical protein